MQSIPERANPFARRLRLVWNDTLVMDSQCATIIAYDVSRAYFADSFTGVAFQAWLESTFGPGALDRVIATGRLDVEWRDATGYARAVIESLI